MVNAPLTLVTASMKSPQQSHRTRAGRTVTERARPRIRTNPSREPVCTNRRASEPERSQAGRRLPKPGRPRVRTTRADPTVVQTNPSRNSNAPNPAAARERIQAGRKVARPGRPRPNEPEPAKVAERRAPLESERAQAELEAASISAEEDPNEPEPVEVAHARAPSSERTRRRSRLADPRSSGRDARRGGGFQWYGRAL